jgi:hypothetical protein
MAREPESQTLEAVDRGTAEASEVDARQEMAYHMHSFD